MQAPASQGESTKSINDLLEEHRNAERQRSQGRMGGREGGRSPQLTTVMIEEHSAHRLRRELAMEKVTDVMTLKMGRIRIRHIARAQYDTQVGKEKRGKTEGRGGRAERGKEEASS
jgi:hypothetical protein